MENKLNVKSFVPKEVYAVWAEKSWQFVSDNIVKLYKGTHDFFDKYYKEKDNNRKITHWLPIPLWVSRTEA